MQLDRLAIADALRAIGALLELDGAPRFRAEAYVRGARAVEAAKHLDRLVAEGRLQELPGIGAGLAAVVTELATTGRSRVLDELAARMPPGARELAPVATLPQIRRLHEALGVTTLAELEQAAASGRVRAVKGFGPATEAKLLAKVRAFRSATPALRMVAARTLAAAIATHVGETAEVASIVPVGAVRRGEELVEEVEVLALSDAPARALAAFERFPQRIETTAAGADHASLRLVDGTLATLHVAAPADAARALVRTTGPAAHADLVLGALDALGAPRPASEEAVYHMIGRAFVPPELRDLPDALERAAEARARASDWPRLLTVGDVRGVVHCHSTWSDGRHSIAEMARAAELLGMDYLTITDHSPTASYANGVGLDRLERQWEEIARVQETTRVRLLRGTESDILADGALDYPDAVLDRLDVVIASIHNRNQQDEDAMTRRIVQAMRHPVRKIWGHPLGRMLLRRPPVPLRMGEVLDAIAESDAIIELNGDPIRLDLPSEWARAARARGIHRFVVSVDAHASQELRNIDNAVVLARRAGLGPAEVLNTLPVDAFLRAVAPTGGRCDG